MSKLLCFRELGVGSKVVSNFSTLSLLYIILYILFIIYLLNISYYLTITYYIPLYINTLSVGSNVFFYVYYPITLLLFIYWKYLYVNVTIYNNIDTFTKLIRQYNNLYKHYILIKLIYRTHIYTRTWYIIHTRAYTCVHVHTYTHTHVYIHNIYTKYIYILSISCVKIA